MREELEAVERLLLALEVGLHHLHGLGLGLAGPCSRIAVLRALERVDRGRRCAARSPRPASFMRSSCAWNASAPSIFADVRRRGLGRLGEPEHLAQLLIEWGQFGHGSAASSPAAARAIGLAAGGPGAPGPGASGRGPACYGRTQLLALSMKACVAHTRRDHRQAGADVGYPRSPAKPPAKEHADDLQAAHHRHRLHHRRDQGLRRRGRASTATCSACRSPSAGGSMPAARVRDRQPHDRRDAVGRLRHRVPRRTTTRSSSTSTTSRRPRTSCESRGRRVQGRDDRLRASAARPSSRIRTATLLAIHHRYAPGTPPGEG